MDASLQQQAGARLAALAGRREDPRDDTLDRLVEIGIVENDVRRFSAELERHRLESRGGELIDLAPGGIAAGEADMRNRGMRDERRAHLGSESRDDVDDAFGKPRLGEERREFEHRRRRELRRLDHRRASGGERRSELPARQRERRIPWRDDADHALGLVLRVGEHAPLVRRDHRTLHLVGEAAVILEVVAHVPDLGARLRQDLAVVALLDRGQPVDVGDDEIAEPPQQVAALRRAHPRPLALGQRALRRRRRPRRHRASSPRPISAQTLPVYGILGRQILVGGGRNDGSVDVVAILRKRFHLRHFLLQPAPRNAILMLRTDPNDDRFHSSSACTEACADRAPSDDSTL